MSFFPKPVSTFGRHALDGHARAVAHAARAVADHLDLGVRLRVQLHLLVQVCRLGRHELAARGLAGEDLLELAEHGRRRGLVRNHEKNE